MILLCYILYKHKHYLCTIFDNLTFHWSSSIFKRFGILSTFYNLIYMFYNRYLYLQFLRILLGNFTGLSILEIGDLLIPSGVRWWSLPAGHVSSRSPVVGWVMLGRPSRLSVGGMVSVVWWFSLNSVRVLCVPVI